MEQDRPATNSEDEPTRLTGETVIRPSQSTSAGDFSLDGGRLVSSKTPQKIHRYEVIEEIGRGGMGVVYKARDAHLKRLVALKMILSGEHAHQRELERFRSEAEVLARVEHPGIVQVYEVGEHQGHPYLAMEFIDGGSLTDFTQRKPIDPELAARVVEAIARAVFAAHDQGIAHRDLKPDNILLIRRPALDEDSGDKPSELYSTVSVILTPMDQTESQGPMEQLIPKVADFGLAKQVDVVDGMTRTGAILGSPNYMAPEQAKGEIHEVGFSADIYALGGILYFLLTGRPPFQGTTPAETILMVRDHEPVAPTHLLPRLSKDIETICLKCLEKDPAKRFQSVRELREELLRFIRGEPINSRPITGAMRAVRWCRRNRLVASLLASVGVALTTALTIAIIAAVWMSQLVDRETIARQRAESNLIQMHTVNGVRLMDQGRLATALPWLAEAIELVDRQHEENPSFQSSDIPRRRMAAALRQCPKYSQLWFEENFLHQAGLSPDGTLVVGSGKSGLAQVWNVATGDLVGTPFRHDDAVLYSAISPDNRWLATACRDGTVIVWEIASGSPTFDVIKYDAPAEHVAFNPAGDLLVSCGGSKANVWSIDRGESVCTFDHDGTVRRCLFHPHQPLVLSASSDRTARIWHAETSDPIAMMRHADEVRDIAWSDDGNRVATASRDSTARVWDHYGRPLSNPIRHAAVLTTVAFSPDGSKVVTASEDHTARVWDASTGRPVTPPLNHEDYVSQAVFSPDGRMVITAGEDTFVYLWDATTGQRIGQPLSHSDRVNGVAFAPNGRQVLTRATRRIMMWDLPSVEQSVIRLPHSLWVRYGEFSHDGAYVATASSDQTIGLWHSIDGTPVIPPLTHRLPVMQVVFAADDRWLVSICASEDKTLDQPGELCVWEIDSQQIVYRLGFNQPAYRVGVSPDSRWIAAVTESDVTVIDTAKWDRAFQVECDARVFAMDFHPSEPKLAVGSYDKMARILDLHQGQQVGSPLRHTSRIDHLEYSRDGRWLLTTCSGEGAPSYVTIWDADTGDVVVTHAEPDTWYLLHATFDPSLKRMMSCRSASAMVRDVMTGETLTAPLTHRGMLQHAAFNHDGTMIATASWDRTARVWDAKTGLPITPPLEHDEWVTRVEFSPDSSALLTISKENHAQLWNIRPLPDPPDRLILASELVSHQRASIDGSTVNLFMGEARERWKKYRSMRSTLLATTDAQAVAWHRRQQRESVIYRDWPAALFHLDQMIELQPAQTDLRLGRANVYCELNQFRKAWDDLTLVTQSQPGSNDIQCDRALIALHLRDRGPCKVICDQLLNSVNSDDSLAVRHRVATLCLLASTFIDLDVEPDQIVERFISEDDESESGRWIRAAAAFQQHDHDSASQWLGADQTTPDSNLPPLQSLTDAMTQVLLTLNWSGDGEPVRQRADQLREAIDRYIPELPWQQRVQIQWMMAQLD